MIIYSFSDLHLPRDRYLLPYFNKEIEKIEKVDLFILAGDIVDRNALIFLKKVNFLLKQFNCPKIFVRGNNEGEEAIDYVKRETSFTPLEDEWIEVENVKIFGTQGLLDRMPSFGYWKYKGEYFFNKVMKEREEKIREFSLLEGKKILVSHYAVTYSNIIYEPKWSFPELGSTKLNDVLNKFSLIIHGHIHKGKEVSFFNGVAIYNVSFQNKLKLTRIEI